MGQQDVFVVLAALDTRKRVDVRCLVGGISAHRSHARHEEGFYSRALAAATKSVGLTMSSALPIIIIIKTL